MNKVSLFLSHSNLDKELAETFKDLLSRITLGIFDIWFSSDKSDTGGLIPGEWVKQINVRLEESKLIIILLTPNSIKNEWLHFEAGFSAGMKHPVIPVCIGISVDEVPMPLSMYQCYQLSDYESLEQFIKKILQMYDLKFDKELAEEILKKTILKFTSKTVSKQDKKTKNVEDIIYEIKAHVDKRLIGLQTNDSKMNYSVELIIDTDMSRTSFLQIRPDMTIEDVLNKVYYMISNKVKPYTYLVNWVLQNEHTKRKLILSEIQDIIPAYMVIQPDSVWRVVFLDKPYFATSSYFRSI